MKTKKGALDPVVAALADLSANRLPLPLTTRIHNVRKVVLAAARERDEIKNALVLPYLKPGSLAVEQSHEGYPELLAKLNELWNEEVELDTGPPIDLSRLNGQADAVQIKPESLTALDDVGLLVLESSPERAP